ncbi:hypothetical protein LCGC14_2690830 [marine sediment metagenome]|uniref:Homeodomain phBC6A51-type domain-containing protein n=1 Tax=marine sediment metagenome TaxID=412755 RepID=A0A0F8ZIL5_9ZZZZ
MERPRLPKNPATDKPAQRVRRLDYIFWLISEGYTVSASCKWAGITRKSFYHWINHDPELLARYEEAQIELHEEISEIGKLAALKALTDPRYQSSLQFYLRSKCGWNDGTGIVMGQGEMPSINFTRPQPKNAAGAR